MIFDYFQQHFQIFLNVFARVFGLLLLLPVMSSGVPAMARAGLGFFVALLSTPMVVAMKTIPIVSNISTLGIYLLSSLLLGLAVGFIVQITVSSVQLSSSIFSTTMGLSFSENVNPLTQENIPALGNFLSVLVMLLFIRTESHITYIEAIINSFKEIPIIHFESTKALLVSLKSAAAVILIIAFQLSMPLIAITLMLDIAMGIIGRVAPQFNVMIMGWNIKIFVGFFMLWLILPSVLDISRTLFRELHSSILSIISMAKGA